LTDFPYGKLSTRAEGEKEDLGKKETRKLACSFLAAKKEVIQEGEEEDIEEEDEIPENQELEFEFDAVFRRVQIYVQIVTPE